MAEKIMATMPIEKWAEVYGTLKIVKDFLYTHCDDSFPEIDAALGGHHVAYPEPIIHQVNTWLSDVDFELSNVEIRLLDEEEDE